MKEVHWKSFDFIKDGYAPFCSFEEGSNNSFLIALTENLKMCPIKLISYNDGSKQIFTGYGYDPRHIDPIDIIAIANIEVPNPPGEVFQQLMVPNKSVVLVHNSINLGEFFLRDMERRQLIGGVRYFNQESHCRSEKIYGMPFTIEGDSLRFTDEIEQGGFVAERVRKTTARRIFVDIIKFEKFVERSKDYEQKKESQRRKSEVTRTRNAKRRKAVKDMEELGIRFDSSKSWEFFEEQNTDFLIESYREDFSKYLDRITNGRFERGVSKSVADDGLQVGKAADSVQQEMEIAAQKRVYDYFLKASKEALNSKLIHDQ